MDFAYHYSQEQEDFRKEVRAWLAENVDPKMKTSPREEIEGDVWDWGYAFAKKLGAKGWLHPTYPKEYGGGGLSPELSAIIHEELDAAQVPVITGNTLDLPALSVWATEEQKQEFLKGRLTGELIAYQNFTEPGHGSDLASLETKAVRDGDDWLITGNKVYVSGSHGKGRPRTPDYLFTVAVTDPDAPRHRNLGYFLVPTNVEGVSLTPMNLVTGNGQNHVVMDNVRVGPDRLIGGEFQGWQVANSTLEHEHGGRGELPGKNRVMESFINVTSERGWADSDHTANQAMEAYIVSEIGRLFELRNHAFYTVGQEMTFQGSQNSLWRKEKGLVQASAMSDVMGPYSLLDDSAFAIEGGEELQQFQLNAIGRTHPGGTIEIQKVIMARRIGISRTTERAAPTPSTAGQTASTKKS